MLAAADIQQQQAASRLAQPPEAPFAGGDVPLVQLTGDTGRDVPLNYGTLTEQFVGSEQATLGVAYQALADWGLLTGDEMGFLGVQPASVPSWVLSTQDLGILQNNLVDAGIDPNVVWEIYETMMINGKEFAVLKDDGSENLYSDIYDDYYSDSDSGYSPGRYSPGGYYNAPGSFRSGYTSGLINWRIGF
jgi:hypothetical protein